MLKTLTNLKGFSSIFKTWHSKFCVISKNPKREETMILSTTATKARDTSQCTLSSRSVEKNYGLGDESNDGFFFFHLIGDDDALGTIGAAAFLPSEGDCNQDQSISMTKATTVGNIQRTAKVSWAPNIISEMHYRPSTKSEDKKEFFYDALDFQRFRALSEYERKAKMMYQKKAEELSNHSSPISCMVNSLQQLLAPFHYTEEPKMRRCTSHRKCLDTLVDSQYLYTILLVDDTLYSF